MLDRLHELLLGLGAPDGMGIMDAVNNLARAYSGPSRYYHNLGHISRCLAEFDTVRDHLADPTAVEVALWFHDVICEPLARDNEGQSAAVADRVLHGCNRATEEFRETVFGLILATKHDEKNNLSLDTKHLLDIDLSVLGGSWPAFKRYNEQIRMEYYAIPENAYLTKRLDFLHRLLGLGHIYHTPFFWERYEAAARENITRLISEMETRDFDGAIGKPESIQG